MTKLSREKEKKEREKWNESEIRDSFQQWDLVRLRNEDIAYLLLTFLLDQSKLFSLLIPLANLS